VIWSELATVAALDPGHARQVALGRAFYPLTMPLSVDAGAISVAITWNGVRALLLEIGIGR